MTTSVLVATRSVAKLREMQLVLGSRLDLDLYSLSTIMGPEADEEADIEVYSTFEQNAAAKALYVGRRTGHVTLADDSGLCVDALGGAPGVRSRRYAADHGLPGSDEANNALLLHELQAVPVAGRTARYVCAVAVAKGPDLVGVRLGSCSGVILGEQRGEGGFGYDPLFWVPSESATFAEIPLSRKNEISHRARALEAATPLLRASLRHPRAPRRPPSVDHAAPVV